VEQWWWDWYKEAYVKLTTVTCVTSSSVIIEDEKNVIDFTKQIEREK